MRIYTCLHIFRKCLLKCTFLLQLFLVCNCVDTTAQAPSLWGSTTSGGVYYGGTLFRINGNGSPFELKNHFETDAGYNPLSTRLLDGDDGYVYGLTSDGGYYSDGVIFRINKYSHLTEVIYQFQNFTDSFYLSNHQDGSKPRGSMVKGADGLFYGMCAAGGAENMGTIFRFSPSNFNYEVLYDFIDSSVIDEAGRVPWGSLTWLNDSIAYAVTTHGGMYETDSTNYGTIFKFNIYNRKYTSVFDFSVDGFATSPEGDLLLANDGWLYGTANGPNHNGWGADGKGILFRFHPGDNVFENLINFNEDSIAGKYPARVLVQASNGLIYGTTEYGGGPDGGGIIFSYDPVSHQRSLVHKFKNSWEGFHPYSSLTEGYDGWLYGTTISGGLTANGTIYKYSPTMDTVIRLADLSLNELGPYTNLLLVDDTLFYGLSAYANNEAGSIFCFNRMNNVVTDLFEFRISDNGCNVTDGLVQVSDGKLLGFTHEGGNYHAGVHFQYTISTGYLYENFEFREDLDKAYLPRGMLAEFNGSYYGNALYHYDGGSSIYSFSPNTQDYKIEVTIDDPLLGENPQGPLLLANDGYFYGTMSRGGATDNGTIFRFNPSNAVYEMIFDFSDPLNGAHPAGSFVQAADGRLYGLTSQGGIHGDGTIFRFDPETVTYEKVFDFIDTLSGKNPKSRMTRAVNGPKMYGAASGGGTNKDGVIFSYDFVSDQFTKLLDFTGSLTGSHPKGALLLASDGLLYGTAEEGGDNNFGTVFRLNPENAVFSVIHHFNGADGRWPVAELMEENPSLTGVSFDDRKFTMGVYPNPSNGDFKIMLSATAGSFDRLVVYDVLGNEVFSRNLTSTLSSKPIEVNVSHRVQAGLYTLQLSGPKGSQTEKIIIE